MAAVYQLGKMYSARMKTTQEVDGDLEIARSIHEKGGKGLETWSFGGECQCRMARAEYPDRYSIEYFQRPGCEHAESHIAVVRQAARSIGANETPSAISFPGAFMRIGGEQAQPE